MTHKKQIIDTSYVEPKKQKFYTIQEVANKMNTSTTKINSYIYKISNSFCMSIFFNLNCFCFFIK